MHAFIVRPFGTKEGIDFDRVEAELISPALDRLDNMVGRTTGEIVEAGNIRADMFLELLLADIVIADISVHNANVFYELGVRHALRDKRTFLIRAVQKDPSPNRKEDVPFDLKTDRYLSYDEKNAAGAVNALVEGLRSTLDSGNRDSPVFQLLPELQPPARKHLVPVPSDFREEVERAWSSGHTGDLALLGAEARLFKWCLEGLRLVARAQFNLKAYLTACATWEELREFEPVDLEANTRLGTIYERLGDPIRSDQAVNRVLRSSEVPSWHRAEAFALLGRNFKTKWIGEWNQIADSAEARRTALRSEFLKLSCDEYSRGFEEDLNHYYSGINALAMLTLMCELAKMQPEVWAERFDTVGQAESELALLLERRGNLVAAVDCSLRAAQTRAKQKEQIDEWAILGAADLRLLTAKNPKRVAAGYREAVARANVFEVDSIRRQLTIYRRLSVLTDNATASLAELSPSVSPQHPDPLNIILFTGHMIDRPGADVRFPPEKELIARAKIKKEVENLLKVHGRAMLGIAGGASGGDILFHEICDELGIRTQMFLALPNNAFIDKSVAPAGAEWIVRFQTLAAKIPIRVLSENEELPRWLRARRDYTLWQRNNLWMLHNAMAAGVVAGEHAAQQAGVTLIALWDGKSGKGPGGTKDMVDQARELGAHVIHLKTQEL